MKRLRDPDSGCPWDLEQTHASLRDSLLEETYETLDVLTTGEPMRLLEELGDLLLQIIFHSQIASDEGQFTMDDVVVQLNHKLIRRHPHVFGEGAARTSPEVVGQWEQLKAAERAERGEAGRSMLAGISKSLPALAYAEAVLGRARRVGFDWVGAEKSFAKVGNDVAAFSAGDTPEAREAELGELLFSLVGVAHRDGIDAEQALRGANNRFYARFERLEQALLAEGRVFTETAASKKFELWEQATEGKSTQ